MTGCWAWTKYVTTVSFNACRRDQEEGVELDFQQSPGKIKSREVELGSEGMLHGLSLQVVPQQRCNGHCLCDCPAQQLKQQVRGTLVSRNGEVPTVSTLLLFWRWSPLSQHCCCSGGGPQPPWSFRVEARGKKTHSTPPPPPPNPRP